MLKMILIIILPFIVLVLNKLSVKLPYLDVAIMPFLWLSLPFCIFPLFYIAEIETDRHQNALDLYESHSYTFSLLINLDPEFGEIFQSGNFQVRGLGQGKVVFEMYQNITLFLPVSSNSLHMKNKKLDQQD